MERVLYTFKDFLRERIPDPVRKLPVHTLLGCPHREDRTGPGGCIYCNEAGFSTLTPDAPAVDVQIRQGIAAAREKGFRGRFLVYFQTGTNTFGDPKLLQSWWSVVEQFDADVVGLAVGTRPDCISRTVLEILSDLGSRHMVWLELGLQSAKDETLRIINRGHDFKCFTDAVSLVSGFPLIHLCAHIILGLPGESVADMRKTILELNRLPVHGLKIHHLQVVRDTVLETWYRDGLVPVFTEEAYIRLLEDILPLVRRDICLHRLIGDVRQDLLIAPKWGKSKSLMLQEIERRMRRSGRFQGSASEMALGSL